MKYWICYNYLELCLCTPFTVTWFAERIVFLITLIMKGLTFFFSYAIYNTGYILFLPFEISENDYIYDGEPDVT